MQNFESDIPTLSKSRYLSGDQCYLRLWYDSHERDLVPPPDSSLQAVFDTEHEVGRLARKRYPRGHSIGQDDRHVCDALEETRKVIEAGKAPALFEAAFRHEDVLVSVDILERLSRGGWRLCDVKSTSDVHAIHVPDVAIQLWVLRGAGLDVREVEVITLNRDYVHDGIALDPHSLFRSHLVLDEAEALQEIVSTRVKEMLAMLGRSAAPDIVPGAHCFTPRKCPYYAHCTRDVVQPDHGVGELPLLHACRRAQLEAAGIKDIRDIPSEFPLTALQAAVRQAVQQQRAIVHEGVSSALAELTPPVHYLNLETFMPAIPRYAGTRPFEAIPFQFSVHTVRGDVSLGNTHYLHEQDDDPRTHVADRLIEAVGTKGSICTYSHTERTTLNALAAALPERAKALTATTERLFDLRTVVRDSYYHPEFRGSFSMNSVLPVLVPGMGYGDLEIRDSTTATAQYTQALRSVSKDERQQNFRSLRAYCHRNTLAMVRLRDAIRALMDRPRAGSDGRAFLYCSFCGKSQFEVRQLIAGLHVNICDACVQLCNDIMLDDGSG